MRTQAQQWATSLAYSVCSLQSVYLQETSNIPLEPLAQFRRRWNAIRWEEGVIQRSKGTITPRCVIRRRIIILHKWCCPDVLRVSSNLFPTTIVPSKWQGAHTSYRQLSSVGRFVYLSLSSCINEEKRQRLQRHPYRRWFQSLRSYLVLQGFRQQIIYHPSISSFLIDEAEITHNKVVTVQRKYLYLQLVLMVCVWWWFVFKLERIDSCQ